MKTGLCQFSGFKIYPGHGLKYVRGDSKAFTFVDKKCGELFLQKRNPREIRWTQIYRRLHKKGQTEEVTRKKTRKTQKLQRAIVGASLAEIRQKRSQKPEIRAASREAALKEIKERKKEKQAKKQAAAAAAKKTGPAAQKQKPSKQPKAAAPKQGVKGSGQKR